MMSGATQDCTPSKIRKIVSVIKPEPLDNVPDSNESSPGSSSSPLPTYNYRNFIGLLIGKDNMLLISDHVIEVGRNSYKSLNDFHVGTNRFVSRNHFIIQHDMNGNFKLFCLSKNGVFIDGVFRRKSGLPYKLPVICHIQFPNTDIALQFENLIALANNGEVDLNNINKYTQAKIGPLSIPLQNITSNSVGSGDSSTSDSDIYGGGGGSVGGGYSSPTSMISAANSCPASPSQNVHDFAQYRSNHHHHPSNISHSTGTNTNNNNYSEFQAPATQSLESDRPPYSYAQLIVQAISASPEKQLTLSGIYSFISKNYPYYRTRANKGWKNAIRHNLSLNHYFIKGKKSKTERGKGYLWRIERSKKLRSAPVSPNYTYNSREGSPINEELLLSAPGSPGQNNSSYSANNHDGSHQSSYQKQNTAYASADHHPTEVYEEDEQMEYESDDYEPCNKRQKIYFIKGKKSKTERGKGYLWRIERSKKLRSAPVSPNYTYNSREGSPINEELLLSAPGSPGQNNSSYSANNHDGSHQSSYQKQNTAYASADHNPTEVYEEDEQMEYESDDYEPCNKRQKIYFIKGKKSKTERGKGYLWRIERSKKLRSAPVSPNYTYNSREGSPINEELLLSAPGSPGQNNSSYSANNHDGSHQSSYQKQNTAYASADHNPTEVYEEDEQMEYESDDYEPCNKRQKM